MIQPLSNESLAEVDESDLVRRLLQDAHWRSRFLGIHGIPVGARAYPEVPHGALGMEGDIDILVVDPLQPQYATGVQVKRIKVTSQAFQTGKPNKLAELSKLHEQSNRLVQLGFWQVFSYVLVVVDSRENNQGKYCYEGLTRELRTIVDDSLKMEALHHRAGFVRLELVQPIDDLPLGAGTFSARVLRSPTVHPQPDNITTWVSSIISSCPALEEHRGS